jgi:hypothetical protein
MANTLTNLLPDIYTALNVVSREKIGLVQSVNVDGQASSAAVGQKVYAPVVPAMSAVDISASNTSPDGADTNVGNVEVEISNQRSVTFRYTGEEQAGLGTNYPNIVQQSFAQAFRTISNEVEEDLAQLYTSSSRAYGTAGTTPFGTGDDLTDLTNVMAILDDNGAPSGDRSLVLGSAAAANLLGKQPAIFKVNEAGNDMAQRRAMFNDLFGSAVAVSGKIQSHTKGTGSSYLLDGALSIGDTTATVDTGSGTILAGDIITIAGDSNKYVNGTALSGGDIVLNNPGLLEAAADNAAITVGNDYTANLAFSRDAFLLASRAPYLPEGGDSADDRTYVTDPVSGLTFEISMYRQFRQTTILVGLAWGVKAVKPEHAAILLG